MEATIVPDNVKHYPVLLKEIISVISPQHGGTFIDCTFGQGGYSKKILENKNNKVIAIDRDLAVVKLASEFKKKYENRFYFENIRFSEINNEIHVDLSNNNSIVDNKVSNGLENFELEEETPELFNEDNTDSTDQEFTSFEPNEKSEEDDLEIPAFLRRQKN